MWLCAFYAPPHSKWRFCVSVRIKFTLSSFGIGCLKILLPLRIIWFKQWNKIAYAGWTFKSWKRKWSVFEKFCLLYIPIYLVKQRSNQWNSSGSFALLLTNKSTLTNPLWKVHLNNFKDRVNKLDKQSSPVLGSKNLRWFSYYVQKSS